IVANNTSLVIFSKSPNNISVRLNMIFSTKLACEAELEIRNREAKKLNASKCVINRY
ncbi:hypothetical protein BY458DRAFT_435190, partial [Sporodiniella umbellata]